MRERALAVATPVMDDYAYRVYGFGGNSERAMTKPTAIT
jgi:hypothetical protein